MPERDACKAPTKWMVCIDGEMIDLMPILIDLYRQQNA